MNRTLFTLLSAALGATLPVACTTASPPPAPPAPAAATSAPSASSAPPAPLAVVPAPPASTQAAPPVASRDVDKGKPSTPALPAIEPKCPPGKPVAFYTCALPKPEEPNWQLATPFETCPESRGGKPFSPRETSDRRPKAPGTCCYLDRCQLSFGY